MNKKVLWGLVGVIIVIALLTNPGPEQHAAAFMTYMLHRTSEEMTTSEAATEQSSEGLSVTSKNFWLFSLTMLKQNQNSKNIGFGAFGNVWIFK